MLPDVIRAKINDRQVVIRERIVSAMIDASGKKDADGSVRKWGGKYLVDISPDLKPVDHLDALIHELLHVAFWNIDEEEIEYTATDLARILRKAGWRHESEL